MSLIKETMAIGVANNNNNKACQRHQRRLIASVLPPQESALEVRRRSKDNKVQILSTNKYKHAHAKACTNASYRQQSQINARRPVFGASYIYVI